MDWKLDEDLIREPRDNISLNVFKQIEATISIDLHQKPNVVKRSISFEKGNNDEFNGTEKKR